MKQEHNIKQIKLDKEAVVVLKPELAISHDKERQGVKEMNPVKTLYDKEISFYEFYYTQKPTVA